MYLTIALLYLRPSSAPDKPHQLLILKLDPDVVGTGVGSVLELSL